MALLSGRKLYRHSRPYRSLLKWARRTCLPLMGGLPLYWVAINFWKNLQRESLGVRASSIAFNLFLSLFPSLIALFTLLPYIPVPDLNKEIIVFLKIIMPSSAFQTIDDTLNDVMQTRSGSLLSFGLIGAIYFASNGVFSLMSILNKHDTRSYWHQKAVSIGVTLVLGALVIAGLCLILATQFSIEMLVNNTRINQNLLYYVLVIAQWVVLFVLLFGAIIILYRHGDIRTERWRYVAPGALMASLLSILTGLGYGYYVSHFAHYNKVYGSLGAMIITMLWLYFNSMGIIIGHDFNRGLVRTRAQVVLKEVEEEETDELALN